ncbi:hypothetical protein ONZ45_g6343 [Pleurotus djamor]|nr:hypothetical protein ONZ45_g6343 [Pleurotus djamor]
MINVWNYLKFKKIDIARYCPTSREEHTFEDESEAVEIAPEEASSASAAPAAAHPAAPVPSPAVAGSGPVAAIEDSPINASRLSDVLYNASAIKSYLSKRGLGTLRSDGVLLPTTLAPPKCLASEAEAKAALASRCPPPALEVLVDRQEEALSPNNEEFFKFQAEKEQFAPPPHSKSNCTCYLKRDLRAGEIAFDAEKATTAALQAKLDSTTKEARGQTPTLKASSLSLTLSNLADSTRCGIGEITAPCITLLNRADPDMLIMYMQHRINQCKERLMLWPRKLGSVPSTILNTSVLESIIARTSAA